MSQDTQAQEERYEVRTPVLYTGMPQQEQATILYWYIEEGKNVQPGDLLVRIETLPKIFNVPSPYQEECRVVRIHKRVGDTVRIGDLLVTLAPLGKRPGPAGTAP